MTLSEIEKITKLLTRKNLPFCIYSLPDESELNIVVHSNDNIELTDDVLTKNEPGFIYRSFDKTLPPKFIRASYAGRLRDFLWKKFEVLPDVESPKEIEKILEKDISHQEYIQQVSDLVQKLKAKELQKIVYSRTKTIATKQKPEKMFFQLLSQSPKAFCYLLRTDDGGIWFGATPEILVEKKEGMYHSVALAGTVVVEEKESLFSDKNIGEQKVVLDYILHALKTSGAQDIKYGEPIASPASNLYHIKSPIAFRIEEENLSEVVRITEALHPTPAVGGLPIDKVLEQLEITEPHSRSLYAGYLGVVNILGKTALFVNIRCASYHGGEVCIYVGGGLMYDSDPELEWEETEVKARLILGVV